MKPILFTALAFLVSAPAFAASSAANLTNSASVPTTCVINTTSALVFAAYDPVGKNKTSAVGAPMAPVAFRCTQGAIIISITMNGGQNVDTSRCSTYPRRMKSPLGDYLYYRLYANSVNTTNGSTGQNPPECTGITPGNAALSSSYDPATNSSTRDEYFYAYASIPSSDEVPAHKTIRAGQYTDSVVVSIKF